MIALIGFFVHFASCSVKMTSIIRGNWSFNTIYPPESHEFEKRFIVQYRGDIANYLYTFYDDEIVNINVSFVDLSGNFTFLDQVYYFDFTMKARPYISTDIDMHEYGLLHCTFCSYSSMHCIWAVDNNTYSIYGERQDLVEDLKPWYIRHKNNLIMGCAFIIIVGGFHFATNKLQKSMIEDMRKQELEKKRKAEEEKLKLNNAEEDDEDKNEEEQNIEATITEPVPDENGKVKAD